MHRKKTLIRKISPTNVEIQNLKKNISLDKLRSETQTFLKTHKKKPSVNVIFIIM